MSIVTNYILDNLAATYFDLERMSPTKMPRPPQKKGSGMDTPDIVPLIPQSGQVTASPGCPEIGKPQEVHSADKC